MELNTNNQNMNNVNPANNLSAGKAAKGCFGLSKAAILGIAALLVLGVWGCSSRNNFVKQRTDVDASWSNVETQYQRRNDLYKSIAANVKKYDKHESETYQGVTNARAGKKEDAGQQLQALTSSADSLNGIKANPNDVNSMKKYIEAQNKLREQFSVAINVVHEAYPDLKAEDLHKDFNTEIEGTENRISVARKNYIEKVKTYNTNIDLFPGMIVARIFGFTAKPFFEADPGTEKVPDLEGMLED